METYCVTPAQKGQRYITQHSDNRLAFNVLGGSVSIFSLVRPALHK